MGCHPAAFCLRHSPRPRLLVPASVWAICRPMS